MRVNDGEDIVMKELDVLLMKLKTNIRLFGGVDER